jgi:TolB-like protein
MTALQVASTSTATNQPLKEIAAKQDKTKRKRDKVRSAWISFVGRILAQAIGATATIVLSLMFVQRHQTSIAAERDRTVPVPSVTATAVSPDPRSLAVLPLQNFSGDSNADCFADAMTDALIAELAQTRGLRVTSRTSSMTYKQARTSLRAIARDLGVRWIVEGSFTRSGGRIRVTTQLIDGTTDQHQWAQSYQRPDHGWLSVQTSVAAAIARDVRQALPRDDER